MATAAVSNHKAMQTKEAARQDVEEFMKRSVKFTPFAEAEHIEISVGMVKNVLATRSKSGREPANGDIMKFLMLCKSRRLNPFVGDAYLLGYDTTEGNNSITKWNLITAIQALRKRAEGHPQYDGTQCGVIVKNGEEITEREGTLTLDGEKLLGGWAIVHRKDRKVPERRTVKRATYDTTKSRWSKDPEGMIAKCAEAAALRAAFPSDLADLYVREEFDSSANIEIPAGDGAKVVAPNDLNSLAARLTAPKQLANQPELERDQSEINAQDASTVDQRVPDDGSDGTGGIDPYSGSGPSPEEIAEQDREKAAKGGKSKQKSAFETNPNVGN